MQIVLTGSACKTVRRNSGGLIRSIIRKTAEQIKNKKGTRALHHVERAQSSNACVLWASHLAVEVPDTPVISTKSCARMIAVVLINPKKSLTTKKTATTQQLRV